jgi:UMF1 family MFS transporter
MLVVVVLAPILGAYADKSGHKKGLLIFWTLLGGLSTMALFHAVPGKLIGALFFTFLAILSFEMSLVFYNSFLTDISDEKTVGRISGYGFALGYIGGGLCLLINLGMILKGPTFFPANDATFFIRASVLFAGLWWLVFSLPLFLSPSSVIAKNKTQSSKTSIQQLKETLTDIWNNKNFRWFLLAFLFYDDGVQTIILMASIFGAKVLGMPSQQLALCYLLIQFVAFGGAFAMGKLADSWGHKKVILMTLSVFSGVVVWAFFMRTTTEFWFLGVLVGLTLGGIQAASRSLFSLFVPADRSGEFFSLFSIVGKASSLMGPFVLGVIAQWYGFRWGVLSLLVFFILGGGLLLRVKVPSQGPE